MAGLSEADLLETYGGAFEERWRLFKAHRDSAGHGESPEAQRMLKDLKERMPDLPAEFWDIHVAHALAMIDTITANNAAIEARLRRLGLNL